MSHLQVLFLLVALLSLTLFSGCVEPSSPPFTAQQFFSKVTDLNYTLFMSGYYDGNFVVIDGNKLSVGFIDINSADINWSQLINFPSGCGTNQAVKIVGSSLVCIDLPIDTNTQTAGWTDASGNWVSDVNFDGNVWFNDSYWDDVSVSLTSSGKPGSKPPVFDEADFAWNFENQALAINEQYLFGGFEMPHDWKVGSNISCHIHAHPLSTNVGDYNFELSYITTNIGDVEDGIVVTTLKQTTEGVANKVYLTEFPDINMTGKTLSNTTEFRLKRLSSSTTDTFTGSVAVDSFGCHYQIDAPGSREKVVK